MKYIIGNWKMAPASAQKAEGLARSISQGLRSVHTDIRVIVCPPFVWIPLVRDSIAFSEKLSLGAQNVSAKSQGAYTGEVSAAMLSSLRVSHVIVGHSERRALGESNDVVAEKLKTALGAGLTPILCVGETSRDEGAASLQGGEPPAQLGRGSLHDERRPASAGREWHTFLREQVESAFDALTSADARKLIVAYEPVWAIGGENPDTPDNALTSIIFIRKIALDRFGESVAERLPVLYGGSVLPETVAPFAAQEGIDGVLVGRASLDPAAFMAVVSAMGEYGEKR